MKRYPFIVFFFAALLFAGCADRIDAEVIEGDEQRTLNEWMRLNVPDAIPLNVEIDSETVATMYYEWVERAPEDAEQPEWSSWIMLEYTGYAMGGQGNYMIDPVTGKHRGNIFMTRSEENARIARSYNVYTHYVPQYLEYSRNGYYYKAQMEVLPMMRLGDEIRIYFPSSLATEGFSLTTEYGYGGNVALTMGYPMVITMRITDIIVDPERREQDMVEEFAETNFGDDRIRVKDNLYIRINEEGKEVLNRDSLVQIYYAGYFLEDGGKGFLFDTNIDSIQYRTGRTGSTSSLSFFPVSSTSNYIAAFNEVFNLEGDILKYDSQLTMVTTSSWAYGSNGKAGSAQATYIQSYEPLIFDMWIYDKHFEPADVPDEEDDD